ncbi:glycoside hydrolase family 15 protein [Nocardioides caldifontis]|uniref:glycoside hydrolase family 15 protein n=1 Tax=Nocardioides caldifontis TaxID=2588938 RepID=UPI0011DF3913|nr:glycoside hydrolase family 15 protein [Nocardioides caldifontis]
MTTTSRAVVLLAAVATCSALLGPPATGAPPPRAADRGDRSTWTEGDKTGFGTARARRSNVWFTLQGGRVSEVFYPDLSTPSVRSLGLVVSDGRTFTDRVGRDTVTTVARPDERSLRFTQVNRDEQGRYEVREEYVTSPRHDALTVRVRLTSLDGGRYRLYVHHDPALDNGGMDDRARTRGPGLLATDGRVASYLVTRPALGARVNDLVGTRTDPWRDLARDHRLDRRRSAAGPGNVVQLGRVRGVTGRPGARWATVVLGFGRDAGKARAHATATRADGWTATRRAYDRGWHRYLARIRPVPASATPVRAEYLASALVLAAAEDKLNPGAIVASPSAPWAWGDELEDLASPSGAYHLVWSRDLYQFGTALWAMGDRAAARRAVDWLFRVQQRKDGSFPQNSDVEGTPVWSELQLDEVALPVVLAGLVGKRDDRTWHGVRKGVRFLLRFRDEETGRRAPYSPQERWENQSGYSPSTIAAQVAALVVAADLARDRGRRTLAREWLAKADRWARRVERWTVTTTGPLSEEPYFLRLTKNGRPDTPSRYEMGDGGPTSVDQRRVVDPSFLDLVRLGITAPDDPEVLSTLPVVDDDLAVTTPNGRFWRRFSFDGYGETRTGGQWVPTDPGANRTLGRGWPLLTGERGEYAVAAGDDADSYLATMAAAAGPSGMISEQVWDGRPPTGKPCCPAGEGTRAATPLVWSHAGLVRLAWTIQRGRPVDRQEVVADRYLR